jgi:hypothetical protein
MTQALDPLRFWVLFPLAWIGIAVLLSALSGWFGLMKRFPDRAEVPLLKLTGQSGSLGAVTMSRILTLSVCPAGLRVGISRVFGPFSRPFLVPWNQITVERSNWVLLRVARLRLGHPASGTLTLQSHIADRLARAAGDRWPEAGSFPEETDGEARARVVKQWLPITLIAATFFTVAPRMMAPPGAPLPPIAVGILFPVIVFGIAALVQYLRRNKP